MSLLAIAYPNIDPVAVQLGPIAIRWYALAYIAGLLIGWRLILAQTRRASPPLTRIDADDFLVWAIAGVILGGRLGYVLFYNPEYYLQRPYEALYVWRGGMSFHGGLIGMVAATYTFSVRRGLDFLRVADVVASVAPIGLLFGRIANFINAELWGRATEAPWGMVFPGAGPVPRHPSQLYEAFLEGAVLLVALQWMSRQKGIRSRPGLIAGTFLAGYAVARMFVELFRQPDVHIGFLVAGSTLGQWLSLPLLVLGLTVIARAHRAA